jgi:hypothetical protein
MISFVKFIAIIAAFLSSKSNVLGRPQLPMYGTRLDRGSRPVRGDLKHKDH